MKKQNYKTVWISDTHLGTVGCKATILNNFLESFDCEELYLVGDIVDGWSMNRKAAYFPQAHINVVKNILSKSKKGTNVKYVIGNHDEFLREYIEFLDDFNFGNIEFANEFIHITDSDKKIWVVHGDLYDGVTRYHKWISHLGDIAYNTLLSLNNVFNYFRQKFGMGYWSLSAFLKHKVKKAVDFIMSFEQTLAKECKKRNCDGVICGHIHHAEIKVFDNGIVYFNDGDFVESCTALIEHFDGTFELIQWHYNGTKSKKITIKKFRM